MFNQKIINFLVRRTNTTWIRCCINALWELVYVCEMLFFQLCKLVVLRGDMLRVDVLECVHIMKSNCIICRGCSTEEIIDIIMPIELMQSKIIQFSCFVYLFHLLVSFIGFATKICKPNNLRRVCYYVGNATPQCRT